MAEYRVIGTPVERVDGPEMLSGQALYGPDVKLPGMLWGKSVRSPIPHGKVLSVDGEKARKHPGVKAVISARDVPTRRYGYAIEDEHIFAIDKVHYVGQPVAAVAAIDEDTAEEALSLIEVEYDELPAVFDAEEAIRDGAPLVHDLDQLNARSVYLASWHPVKGTNIIHQAFNQRGNVEAALQKADYVFEDTFRPSQMHHSYMEPHATPLVVRDINFLWNTGAHAEGLAPSNRAMKDGIGPYRIPDIRVTSTLVYTNKIRGTQLRGLGVPEGSWAIESQMDMIADRLGIDPLELRLKNILHEGDINAIGDSVQSIGLRECLEKVAAAIGWGKSKEKNVGRGLAVIAKSPTTHSSISGAHVHLNEDGSAQVLVGASEIGQGSCVVLSQIAAEELGIPVEAVGITCADTGATPYDRGTFSSRVTFYTGMAVKKAAEDAKRQLFEMASKMLEIPASDLVVENQRVVSVRQPQAALTLREILEHAHNHEKPILGRGWYGGKGDYPSLPHKTQGKEYVPGWKYAAQAVEVEVDEETGIIKVIKIASAHDVGTSLNPIGVRGQIVGGVVMGLGYALHERLEFEEGRGINPSFMDYTLPYS